MDSQDLLVRCGGCERAIPNDAAFCIYCATPTSVAPGAMSAPAPRPATGATIRLQSPKLQRPKSRPQPPVVVVTKPRTSRTVMVTPMPSKPQPRSKKRRDDHSGTLLVIGGLFLFAIGQFWPGILLLIGLTRFIKHNTRGKLHRALSRVVFWVGLAVLWNTPFLWPGILLLIFASHIIDKQRHLRWA